MTGEGTAPPPSSLQRDIARCVHCGFCLQACPTYLELGMETDSPRGRIALIDALASGRAQPTPPLLSHLDLCLQCRACETACPSGVPYGRIMETARATVLAGGHARKWRIRAGLLRAVIAWPRLLAALMWGLRLYGHSPLRAAVRGTGVLRFSGGLSRAEMSLPELPRRAFRPPAQRPGLPRTVALLTGCVMPYMYPGVHEATVRVLNRLGYQVIFPAGQTCCGALSAHAGDAGFARRLARRNTDAFLAADVDAVVVNAAGCGSTMKEYTVLLADDPAYAARARRLSAITRDVLEFVAKHDLGALGQLHRTVTYQDSCHLVHGQRVAAAPRAILRAIPGLELRELAAPDRCCGSAGLYSLVQPSMAGRLLERKMDDVRAADVEVVATANPGCMAQLQAGLRLRRLRGDVVHVIELLDEAMAAGAAGGR